MKEQVEVKALKEGRHVVIDDEPCRIVKISKSKPGKHGSAKSRVEAIGIFDGQKRSIVQPVNAKIYVPIIERKRGQVISISGETIQIMDLEDYSMIEVPKPSKEVKEGEEVTYMHCMGRYSLEE